MQLNATEVVRMPDHSHGKNVTRDMVTENKSLSTSRTVNINFDEFSKMDGPEWEQEYQRFLRERKYPEAAIALLGAAVNGDSDSMDYVLKVNIKAFDYIRKRDLENTQFVISELSKRLQR